jgi:hypothetical protein
MPGKTGLAANVERESVPKVMMTGNAADGPNQPHPEAPGSRLRTYQPEAASPQDDRSRTPVAGGPCPSGPVNLRSSQP